MEIFLFIINVVLIAAIIGGAIILFRILTNLLTAILILANILVRPAIWVINLWRLGPLGDDHTQHIHLRTNEDIRVIDGDTIRVGKNRIRIAYIDAPEKATADAWLFSKKSLEKLLSSKQNRLEVRPLKIDKYGRTVAMLRWGAYDVGLTLVKMGAAIATKDAPEAYHKAEQWAKASNVGLWNNSSRFILPSMNQMLFS